MKTETELKFDKIIKQGIHFILKPLGFKKKGNNFYINKDYYGFIVNIQKSVLYSKDHIEFIINTGVFIPEVWAAYSYNENKPIPIFPREVECPIRIRIGGLINGLNQWYICDDDSNENVLIEDMKNALINYILPYLLSIQTKDDLLKLLNDKKFMIRPLDKLIYYGENNYKELLNEEFNTLINKKDINQEWLKTVIAYGNKYKLHI
jgi:Domain of unknown function (DUF4304)